MTPRHTTPAPVAPGAVRALTHGRGRGRTAAEQTAGVSGSGAGLEPRTKTHRILEGC